MLTPELKAQMVKIASQRGYTLEQLGDAETMKGLLKDGLAALDKLCMEVAEGTSERGRGVVREIAGAVWFDVRVRQMAGQV